MFDTKKEIETILPKLDLLTDEELVVLCLVSGANPWGINPTRIQAGKSTPNFAEIDRTLGMKKYSNKIFCRILNKIKGTFE